MFRSYTGCNAWSEIRERIKKPNYYSRKDSGLKIRTNKQKSDAGKYSFLNRTIIDWNNLPTVTFESLPRYVHSFKNRLKSGLV